MSSGWSAVHHHGRAVVVASMLGRGGSAGRHRTERAWVAIVILMFAGAADMVSGIFRGTIWNQTIPD